MAVHGVGIDIVDVRRITRLVEAKGEAFTSRWFTADEMKQCDSADHPSEAFAARLAAKEAVWKALGLDGNRSVPWRSIQILAHDGRQVVALRDEVADVADANGIHGVSVSTTSFNELAMAIALAWRTPEQVVARPAFAGGLGFRHE